MNINPSSDNDMAHIESGDGMTYVDAKKYFLEIEKNKQPKQIDDSKLLMPLHVNRKQYNTHEELYQAIYNWWTQIKNRASLTIKRRISYARKMQNHEIYPINWFEFIPEQIINHLLYLQHVEYKEKAKQTGNPNYGTFQVHNYHKTVNTFAEAFGVDKSYWGYTPPQQPEPLKKIVPRPPTVNKLMHHRYTSDPKINSILKTTTTLGFHAGCRPEEWIIQKCSDVFIDEGYIFIREPKKKYRERQLFIDDTVMKSYNVSSIKNWLEIWRPRIANEYSGDYFFIKPNGKPFNTTADFRGFLNQYCKPVWPYFKPKIMRDWSAIGRLIRQMTETGHWNVGIVSDDLGHKSEATTKTYVRFARDYMRNDNYDWLRAVLKFHPTSKHMKKLMKQVNRPSQKQNHATEIITKTQKTPLTDCDYSRWKLVLPTGLHTLYLLLKKSLNKLKNNIVNKNFFSISNSFFFYFFNDSFLSLQKTQGEMGYIKQKNNNYQHQGSQLKKETALFFHPILSSSPPPQNLSEIPAPITKTCFPRARNLFSSYLPPKIFNQNYPSPSPSNKNFENEINGVLPQNQPDISFSPTHTKNNMEMPSWRWKNT